MKILGIDPGIGKIGWGLIEEKAGKLTALSFDCLETPPKTSLESRLLSINQYLTKLIKEIQPDAVAVEELFFAANAKTALMVGQGRGVILLTIAQAQIPLFSYTPLQVKQAITGYGRAEKRQVQKMVQSLLCLEQLPKQDDAADALAIAITHAMSYKIKNREQNYKF